MTFTNSYDPFVPEIWSTKLNLSLQKNCVMLQCVNRNWEGDIKNQGDTVHILTPGDVSISDLSDSAIVYNEIAPIDTELVIDQQKVFAFKVNDIAACQANTSVMESYILNAQKAIEVAQDSYLLGKSVDVPSNNTLTVSDLGTSNVYQKFVELARILKDNNALTSTESKPWVVINPYIEEILLTSPQFTSASQIGDTTLREGAIGRIAGLDVLVSTNISKVNSQYTILAGTNEAITFASQISKVESLRDPNSFSNLIRGLYLYGAKTVQPKALAKMVCTVS